MRERLSGQRNRADGGDRLRPTPGSCRYRLECRANGAWKTWVDASDNAVDLTVDYREAPETKADAVRLVCLGAPKGLTPAVTELTVFAASR